MTIQESPRFIRATIHQDALLRVPDFYTAGIRDVLNELFQNARRAGATEVRVTAEPDTGTMTVSDDGVGIFDPASILAFGYSQWNQGKVVAEHPAGMGFYALARRDNVIVSSRTADDVPWKVELGAEHFTGRVEAPVLPDPDRTQPGTSVTFSTPLGPGVSAGEALYCARYFPVPVFINGERADQGDFLEKAEYIETWQGVRIGVRRNGRTGRSYGEGSINFYGIEAKAPSAVSISTLSDRWEAYMDVMDAPELQLTLPARRELIQTPFVDELKQACIRAAYRAMSWSPGIAVSRSDQIEANKMGVELPDAPEMLTPWLAATAEYNDREQTIRQRLPESPLVMVDGLEAPDEQVLSRAVLLAGQTHRIMNSDSRLDGYAWYDALPKVVEWRTMIRRKDGAVVTLEAVRSGERKLDDGRVREITIGLLVRDGGGVEKWQHWPTDLVFVREDPHEGWEAESPIVTETCALTVGDMADLIHHAYFAPSDDVDADSRETQEADHREECRNIAISTLEGEEAALKSHLAEAFARHLGYLVPKGRSVTVVFDEDRRVTVELP